MGKKLVLGAAAVVVIVALAVVVAPYFIGQNVESRFRTQVAAFAERTDIPVRVTAYQRHWFSADATTTATLGAREITVDYDIHHGSLPGFDLATVRARWSPKALSIKSDGQPPLLVVRTRIGLGGSRATSIHSAPFKSDLTSSEGKSVHVAWQGMDGRIEGDEGRRLVLKAPGLRVEDDEAIAGFKNLRFTGTGHRLDPDTDQPMTAKDLAGQSSLHFEQVFVRNPDNQHSLTFSGSLDTRSTAPKPDRWNFDSALKLHDIVLPGLEPSAAALQVGDMTVRSGFDGLDGNRFVGLINAIRPYQKKLANADKNQRKQISDQVNAIMAKRLPTLLTDDTALHFGVPRFDTNRGSAGVDITASLTPASTVESSALAKGLIGLVQRTVIKASAHVDKPLMQWFIDQSKNPDQSRKMLSSIARSGFINLNDSGLESSFYMDRKRMRVNGRGIPDRMRKALIMSMLLAASQ